MKTQEKVNTWALFLVAVIRFVFVTAALIFIFAAAINYLDVPLAYAPILATISVGLGGFSAANYISKRLGRRGAVTGFLAGVVIFAIITLVALFGNKGAVTMNTAFHFVIIVLCSVIGGILGVNKKSKKEFI